MAARSDTEDPEADRLYGLPLDQFTPARDELARALRSQGDRERSGEVKRLRKPSVTAWALNQVRRREPGQVDELIAAGERLRDAQQRLVSSGEAGLLRQPAADERRLAEELVDLGRRELVQSGHSVNATIENKLRQTLHAVARDPEVRDLLRAGRLVRDEQISDFGLMTGDEGPGARSRRPTTAPTSRTPRAPTPRGAKATRKAQGIERKLEQARRRQREAEKKLDDAQRRADQARAQASRAEALAREAEAEARKAQAGARTVQAGAERASVAVREAAARTAELERALQALAPDGA